MADSSLPQVQGLVSVVVWRCPKCTRTWHKSGSAPQNFCYGDGLTRHTGLRMEPVEMVPRPSAERLADVMLGLLHGVLGVDDVDRALAEYRAVFGSVPGATTERKAEEAG